MNAHMLKGYPLVERSVVHVTPDVYFGADEPTWRRDFGTTEET